MLENKHGLMRLENNLGVRFVSQNHNRKKRGQYARRYNNTKRVQIKQQKRDFCVMHFYIAVRRW